MKKYQIRIFKTEIIEIFQNVVFHECKFEGCFIIGVHIECEKTGGSKDIYERDIKKAYNIEIVDDPEYELKSTFPKKVILH